LIVARRKHRKNIVRFLVAGLAPRIGIVTERLVSASRQKNMSALAGEPATDAKTTANASVLSGNFMKTHRITWIYYDVPSHIMPEKCLTTG
jgi:hypothetical protein